MRITEEEQEARKNRMIHAAYELFFQDGIDDVSIPKIAEKAGVSCNSIFRYFENKVELVQYSQILLWKEITEHILDQASLPLLEAKTGLEEVEILICAFEVLCKNHSRFFLFSFDCKLFMVRNHKELSNQEYEKMMAPLCRMFLSALERGHIDRSIDDGQSPQFQFAMIWGALRGYLETIVVYDQMYDAPNPCRKAFPLLARSMAQALRGAADESSEKR